MSEDFFTQAFRDEQRRKDEAMMHNMHQLAFGSSSAGSILSAASIADTSTLTTTAATNIYTTAISRVVSSAQPYYKKEVDDAALFMDNKLKISAASPYATSSNNMHKFDDTSAISSSYAITEYFNIIYHDKLLTPGSKCSYAINDTKNVIKHLNFLTQAFENIAQYEGSSTIGIITLKWKNLHMALI